MKHCAHVFLVLAITLSVGSFAQGGNHAPVKMGITQLVSDVMPDNGSVIIAYRVEERINMNFGGRITTYTVPKLSMVSTNDLGPNNSRKITPIYGKAKVQAMTLIEARLSASSVSLPVASAAIRIDAAKPKPVVTSVKIDLIDTYERTLEKGFKSVDMLKRVANARYFEGNMVSAVKWYGQLLAAEKTPDLDFYYRYALALKAVGQVQKGNEFMKIYDSKK